MLITDKSTAVSSLSARSQHLNYEQFIGAQILYQDIAEDVPFEVMITCARAIKNRSCASSQEWADSVQDFAKRAGLRIELVDPNDPHWIRCIEAVNPTAGQKFPFNLANAYTFGKLGIMNPRGEVIWTENLLGYEFKQQPERFSPKDPSIKRIRERDTFANYETLLLGIWVKYEVPAKNREVKSSIAYTLRNLSMTINKSVMYLINFKNQALYFPDILDQDLIESFRAAGDLYGNGLRIYDANSYSGTTSGGIAIPGAVEWTIEIDGIEYSKVKVEQIDILPSGFNNSAKAVSLGSMTL